MNTPPNLFFRIKENGAAVYRVSAQDRQSRLAMQQIATVNVKNGKIKPHGTEEPAPDEIGDIEKWIEKRRAILTQKGDMFISEGVEQLNLLAQFFQSTASDEQVKEHAEDLLMSIHDLRSVLVRKMMGN